VSHEPNYLRLGEIDYHSLATRNSTSYRIRCDGGTLRSLFSPFGAIMRDNIGKFVLAFGTVTLIYGVTAFWLLPNLPPNNPVTGRLPCLYVIGVGIVATVMGLALKGNPKIDPNSKTKTLSPAVGIAILLAMVGLLFVVVSQM
jgi:CDP-diglyceride synthetase